MRSIPIPPKLVAVPLKHIEDNRLRPTDRLFTAFEDRYVSPANLCKIWSKAHTATLMPKQVSLPIAKRAYDFRHGSALPLEAR